MCRRFYHRDMINMLRLWDRMSNNYSNKVDTELYQYLENHYDSYSLVR